MFCFLPLCMCSTNVKAPKGFLLKISKTKMKTKSGQTWKEATKVLATRAPTPLHLRNSRLCSLGIQKGTNVFVASLLSFFFLLLLIFSLSNFSPLLLLVNCFLLHALQGRPSRFAFRDVATPALPSPLVLQSTCVCDASLCSSSLTKFHTHHIHLGKVAFDLVPGPLHPKKAPRRLRALSAGNSSSGALKSYIRHTSSAVAGTLTGRCKSHKDSLQDRAHINQQEEAAKILHSVVWEQPHGQVWLGTQSMGSHAYLPPKSSVDQGSGRRTDT